MEGSAYNVVLADKFPSLQFHTACGPLIICLKLLCKAGPDASWLSCKLHARSELITSHSLGW